MLEVATMTSAHLPPPRPGASSSPCSPPTTLGSGDATAGGGGADPRATKVRHSLPLCGCIDLDFAASS
jgi:hypothetical protein